MSEQINYFLYSVMIGPDLVLAWTRVLAWAWSGIIFRLIKNPMGFKPFRTSFFIFPFGQINKLLQKLVARFAFEFY